MYNDTNDLKFHALPGMYINHWLKLILIVKAILHLIHHATITFYENKKSGHFLWTKVIKRSGKPIVWNSNDWLIYENKHINLQRKQKVLPRYSDTKYFFKLAFKSVVWDIINSLLRWLDYVLHTYFNYHSCYPDL